MIVMDQLATITHNYLALTLLLFVLLILRRMYREDRFRQNMFALRDELFDYAMSGAISFDHPAYTILRTSMNGMIRFAHRVTVTHMLFAYFLGKILATDLMIKNHQHTLEASFNSVENLETRLQIRKFHSQMQVRLVEHLVKSSLVLSSVLGVFILIAMVTNATMTFWKRIWEFVPGFDFLEAEAENIGAQ